MRSRSAQFSVTKFQRKTRKPPADQPHKDERGKPLSWWRVRIRRKGERDETLDAGWVTEAQAEDFRLTVEARVRLGMAAAEQETASSGASLTVETASAKYLEHLEATHGRTLHVSHEERRLLNIGVHLGRVEVARLSTRHLQTFAHARSREPGSRRESTVSRETIWGEMEALQRSLKTCRDLGLLPSNYQVPRRPPKKILPDDRRPRRELTTTELDRLVEALREYGWDEYADLVIFAAWCPARPAEILRLNRNDCRRVLDPDLSRAERKLFFRKTKGGEGRGWRPLTEPAYHALLRQLARRPEEPDAAVWVTSTGESFGPGYFYRVLATWSERASLDRVTPYALRKYAVTKVFEALGNVRAVMAYSGHAKAETIWEHYLDVEAGTADAAAETIGADTAPHLRVVNNV